ncbi:MAG: hypothetical protein Kow0080_24190 [Candidatus Promineifilaceae bacterium]
MRLGKELTGKTIISITDGRLLGNVKDVYVNDELVWLIGLHVGSEGFLKRKSLVITRENVVVFGIDAILVKNSDVVQDADEIENFETWLRLEKLRGREVDTPGGTKVGTIGDIMLDEEGKVTGFTLAKVFVEGPIAEKGQIPRNTLIDTGNTDKVMTIDLHEVEKQLQAQDNEA